MRARSVLVLGGVAGVASLGLASGPAFAADLIVVGTSPRADVVAKAPQAVSVTFDHAPEPRGASLRIYGPEGEVSAAQPVVTGNAVRRVLDPSVPGGFYTVTWSVRDGGEPVAGSFTFTAAEGSGRYAGTAAITAGPAPSGSVPPSPSAAVTEPVSVVPAPDQESGPLAARLLVVPITLVGLLVLASAAIGLISSLRRQSFVGRGLALPWQRHQS